MKNLDNTTALDEYIFNLDKAREAVDRISQYLDDSGEVAPDDVNWGHASSMEDLARQLADMRDKIDKTGEYAE